MKITIKLTMYLGVHMGVNPKIMGKPPKSSILIGFSIINHPFWDTPIFGNTHIFWVHDFSIQASLVNRKSKLYSVPSKKTFGQKFGSKSHFKTFKLLKRLPKKNRKPSGVSLCFLFEFFPLLKPLSLKVFKLFSLRSFGWLLKM